MKLKLRQIYQDIKNVKIQGATQVALAVIDALKRLVRQWEKDSKKEFIRQILETGRFLAQARATEPLADNVVDFLSYHLRKNRDLGVKELKKVVEDSLGYFLTLLEQNNKKIMRSGESLIKFGDRIFTHCHSGTVIKIFWAAKQNKKRFEIFQTETRPLYQGHKTARELLKNNIRDTLVVDSAAPYLISKISGPKFCVDKVIIGCDAIAQDGSCVNKVGSFSLALTAFLNKIPVYVATQALKINEDAKNLKALKLEQRSAREVWEQAPSDLKIYNPAFDKVPAELIQGYICEFGIIKPEKLIKKIKENYSWLTFK